MCASGYLWNTTTSLCDLITCPSETVNETVWSATASGVLANGTCVSGYVVFSGDAVSAQVPQRQCQLSGDGQSASWLDQAVDCEASCAIVGCQHNGTCVGNIACSCVAPSYGRYCENAGEPTCAQVSCGDGFCVPGSDENSPATCNCTGTNYQGSTCSDPIDACLSSPCLNEGLCSQTGANTFSCDCTATLFTGLLCQTETITCATTPCANNGACSHPAPNTVTCNCTGTGYTGSSCQTAVVGDCRVSTYSCQNGACDVGGDDTASCNCNGTEYSGARCQVGIDACLSSPCENGGLCVGSGPGTYTCDCTGLKFTGDHCETQTIVCTATSCQNSGLCVQTGVNQILCLCNATGYSGLSCESANLGDCRVTGAGCQNGGQCQVGASNGTATCTCPQRYLGANCNVDLAAIVAVPALLAVTVIVVLLLRWRYPEADNKVVATLVLAVYDFITDCLFVYGQHTYPNGKAIFYAAVAFVAGPMIFNLVMVVVVLSLAVKKNPELEAWLNANYGLTALTLVLSSSQIEVFGLLRAKLFNLKIFSAPISDRTYKTVLALGLLGNVVEDIPQLVLQLIVASNSLDTVVILSIIASSLTIITGVVKRILLFLLVFLSRRSAHRAKMENSQRKTEVVEMIEF